MENKNLVYESTETSCLKMALDNLILAEKQLRKSRLDCVDEICKGIVGYEAEVQKILNDTNEKIVNGFIV